MPILTIDDDAPAAFGEVAAYREAARVVLRDPTLADDARQVALVRLYERAKAGADHPELTVAAIVAEVAWDLDRADVETSRNVGDVMERRHRQLRADGFDACPTCCSPLSSEQDWTTWRQLRVAAITEAEAREGAVGS